MYIQVMKRSNLGLDWIDNTGRLDCKPPNGEDQLIAFQIKGPQNGLKTS